VVVLLLALAGYPLVQLVRMAFSDVGPTNIIGHWNWIGLHNISAELTNPAFWTAAKTTGEFTLVLLAADLLIGFFGAAMLAERGRATSFVLGLMVFVWAVPPLVSGSVWKFLLDGNGAINAVLHSIGIQPVNWLSSPHLAAWSVAGVAAWASIPFSILIIRGGMLGVSPDLIDAAAIDGAGYWRTQFRIVIPQIKPTLGILSILVVLYAFRSFDFVYVMTSGGPGNVTTTLPYLAYQSAFTTFNWSVGAAVALLSMVVVAVLAVPYVLGVTREEAG
jgi:ABC-type sugar transport system permease subunit